MSKKSKVTLGRSLIKDRFAKNRHRKHVEDNTMLHTTEVNDGFDWGRLNLQSVTAESSLQEFLSTAELAQREFTAEKMNIKYVMSAPSEVTAATSQPDFSEPLTVPRRPKWSHGISAEEQLNNERESFLEWRRHLNELQAKLGAALTPYERNLELWKQLWRTLEKSDVVLILLDARNPLLFRCTDLETYAMEHNCKTILLLNKADLTTDFQRKCWSDYFNKQNIQVIFFSAAKPTNQRKISETNEEEQKNGKESENEDSETESASSQDDNSQTETTINETEINETEINDTEIKETEIKETEINDLENTENDIEQFIKQLAHLDAAVNETAKKFDNIQLALDKVLENYRLGIPIEPVNLQESSKEPLNGDIQTTVKSESEDISDNDNHSNNDNALTLNTPDIYDRDQLVNVLKNIKVDSLKNPPRLTIGMIGYPNVGKSSTVNVLMQTKKVSVSSMPGHTRHIQSLILDDQLEILDCPGLVLPAYAVAPDLLLTAVLPIDQMRAHDAAMARLCQLVGRHTFETKYGLLLPEDRSSPETFYKQILTSHAFNRGFMSAAGQPDVSRSARLLLKDAAGGSLRWEQLPPGCTPRVEDLIQSSSKRKPTPREARAVQGWLNKSAEIDKAFFAMNKSTSHVKGKPILGVTADQAAANNVMIAGKPWKQEKKHANKNKREKLRRVYSHLDQH